jgi:hypothetical protein
MMRGLVFPEGNWGRARQESALTLGVELFKVVVLQIG